MGAPIIKKETVAHLLWNQALSYEERVIIVRIINDINELINQAIGAKQLSVNISTNLIDNYRDNKDISDENKKLMAELLVYEINESGWQLMVQDNAEYLYILV